MVPILLLLLVAAASGHPLPETEPTDAHVVKLQKDLDLTVFVQDFKHNIAQYINNQYTNLTFAEMENVKVVLEDFLRTFAEDLRDILQDAGKHAQEHVRVDDGLPDSTFDEIKAAITAEFKDIDEPTATEIVYRLRKNLNKTKRMIDGIIRDSQSAQIEHSLS